MRRHLLLALIALAAVMLPATNPAAARPAAGIRAEPHAADPAILSIESPSRFALSLDASGIVAWYSLPDDPGRARNLVAAGGRLLALRGPDGMLLVGEPHLEETTAAYARVIWRGDADGPFELQATIWAGGQIAFELRGAAAVSATLERDPAAIVGAALDERPAPAGVRRWMLYLDAWTADGAAPAGTGLTDAPALDADGALVVDAAGAASLRVELPAGLVRQPRLRVSGWPGPELTVRRLGEPLVAGEDYLAAYDAARGELSLQYLHLLPPAADPAERALELTAAQAPPSLALRVQGRTDVNDQGRLVIDANLPSMNGPAPGTQTAFDSFQIPYIQTGAAITLRAVVQNPPANFTGVRFRIPSVGTIVDTQGPEYSASFTLPRRGEYQATAEMLAGGQVVASDSIPALGYGRIFVAVGDSITAGKWGAFLQPGQAGYPVTAPPASLPKSQDGRNFYQFDNASTDPGNQYQSWQIELNDRLRACSLAPVFVLNDGISGIRTARDAGSLQPSAPNQRRNVLAKAAAYGGHITRLGATHLLLQIGTNDASSNESDPEASNPALSDVAYANDLGLVIDALREGRPGLELWVARLPWRNDGSPSEAAQRRSRTIAYNQRIVEVVSAKGSNAPVRLGPDFYAYFSANPGQIAATEPLAGNPDGLHPNAAGMSAIARLWAQRLCPTLEPPERLALPLLRKAP